MTPIYTRPTDAKAVFGISRSQLYRWVAAGHIEIIKRGRMSFVRTKDVTQYIEGLGD